MNARRNCSVLRTCLTARFPWCVTAAWGRAGLPIRVTSRCYWGIAAEAAYSASHRSLSCTFKEIQVPTAAITDHSFPSIDLERKILQEASITLREVKPNCKTEDEVIQNCSGADVLLVQWAPVTRRVLQALPEIRGVVRYGIGVDNIDVQAAKDLGRMVSNVPTYCQEEVSDHTVAMILSLARRIPHDHHQIRDGGWGIT